MAGERGLPPPMRRGRGMGGGGMSEDDPSTYGKLSKLAGMGGEGGGGMGGGGSPDQAAQLVMAGVQQLMEAAQMDPKLAGAIQQAVSVIQSGLQSGLQSMGGEQEGMGGPPPEAGGKKPKKKKQEPPPEEGGDESGGMFG